MSTQGIVPLILPVHILAGALALVPDAIRIPALLAVAVLVPVFAMAYWLWRIRVGRSVRGIIRISTAEAAS